MSAEIRRMRAEDIEAVQMVAQATWASTYRDIIPSTVQQQFLERSYSVQMLRRRMELGVILVAVEEERVIGFANFAHMADSEAELIAIYILPEAQGKGLGGELLQAGLKAYPGIERLRVVVERDNRIGRRFYEAKGFEYVAERVQRLFEHDFHVLEMRLTLQR